MLPRLMGPAQATRGLSLGLESGITMRQISTSTIAFAAPSRIAKVEHTTSSSSASFSSSVPASAVSSKSNKPGSTLTWDAYLKLRSRKRTASLVSSISTTTLAAVTSSSYFLTQDIDMANPILGFDPMYVNIFGVLACTGLGYLIGPSIGESLWSTYQGKLRPEIEKKDRDFYQHIISRRGDPSRQTLQNRPPDFYGEKIGSIAEYRDWLRGQAAYQRKAAHGIDDDLKSL